MRCTGPMTRAIGLSSGMIGHGHVQFCSGRRWNNLPPDRNRSWLEGQLLDELSAANCQPVFFLGRDLASWNLERAERIPAEPVERTSRTHLVVGDAQLAFALHLDLVGIPILVDDIRRERRDGAETA